MMVLPILVEFLREVYGFRGALLLLGGIVLHSAPLLYAMKSPESSYVASNEALNSRSNHGEADTQPLIEQQSHDIDEFCEDKRQNSTKLRTGKNQVLKREDLKRDSSSENDLEGTRSVQSTLNTKTTDSSQNASSREHSSKSDARYFCGWTLKYVWNVLDLDSIKRNPSFIIFYVYRFLGAVTATAWVIFLIPHGVSKGFPLNRAIFLASLGGFGNLLGRVVQGPIIYKRWMTSIDLILVPTMINAIIFLLDPVSKTFAILAVDAFICGLTLGCRTTAGMVFLAENAPKEGFATIYGWSGFFYGLGEPVGGLLAGT